MTVVLIGYGYWGKKIYKALLRFIKKESVIIVDPSFTSDKSHRRYKNHLEAFRDFAVDYCCIATPEETHFQIAKDALNAGAHVFVEKPLCLLAGEARKLVALAKKKNKTLFVDYIFLFDPVVKKIKRILESNVIGKAQHIRSTRFSSGVKRPNITVYDDLAIHDTYLSQYLFGERIQSLSTTPFQRRRKSQTVSSGTAEFHFSSSRTYFSEYSWIHQAPVREMLIFTEGGYIRWGKQTDTDHLQIYNNRTNTVAKKVFQKITLSPLENSIRHFLKSKKFSDDRAQLLAPDNYVLDVAVLESLREHHSAL